MDKGIHTKQALGSVLSAHPSCLSTDLLVREGYRMARAYLQQKVKRGTLRPHFFGLSLDDLALDCCARLIQSDSEQNSVQFLPYFEGLGWQEIDETDLRIALSRFIFHQVNERLFRRCLEVDPGLAGLIQDIELAVESSPHLFSLVRRGSDLWLVAGAAGTELKPLPMVPAEILEAYLFTSIKERLELSNVLPAFVAFTMLEPPFCNGYPVAGLAWVIRSLPG